MPRRKVQPAKLITEANQNLVLANLLKEDLLKTQTRLLFNFDQIEKKYCRSSSGITYSTTDDEMHFDENICTAKSDKEVIKLLHREKATLRKNVRFGGSLLSTPAADPDEKDEKMVIRWKKLNKMKKRFDVDFCVNSMSKDQVKAKSDKFKKNPHLVASSARRGLLAMKANGDVESKNQNGNTCLDKGSSTASFNEAKCWKKIRLEWKRKSN